MNKNEIHELVDNCIGDPESMKKLIIHLIKHDIGTINGIRCTNIKFKKLITILGDKGHLTPEEQEDIRSQKVLFNERVFGDKIFG